MRFYYLLFNILLFTNVISQNSVDYPLDIPIILSGTFGELRPNHFHAGIDIKTQGIEGLNVYSIADGYISRIQITHGGNGKALYIKHDNGQSSVYAHLKKFSKKIEKIVKKVQYSEESYTVKIFPKKNEYRITAKEIIGLSGNTVDEIEILSSPNVFNSNCCNNCNRRNCKFNNWRIDLH